MTKFGVSYFGNRFLSHAVEDIKRIADCSDYIVHTVSEVDLTFHKSVMAKICAASRKAGLEVWVDPWGLGGVFGGESFSKFLLENPKSWQKMSDGRLVPSACLNRPEWRSFVKEWILSVKDMGGQVLFWDEPHVAFDFESEMRGIYACVCDVCQSVFKKKYGSVLPSKLNNDAREFRRESMRIFLEEMMAFGAAKKFKNAVCLYAFKGHQEYDEVWRQAAGLKNLDIFGCDPYWRWRGKRDPRKHVADFSQHVVAHAQANNKESQVWIQAMKLPAGAEGEVKAAVEAAVENGITHVAAWSFDGGELLDPVLSERPKQVWDALEKAFRAFRKS